MTFSLFSYFCFGNEMGVLSGHLSSFPNKGLLFPPTVDHFVRILRA